MTVEILDNLRTTLGDIRTISNGGGDRDKLRFEMRKGQSWIRRSQGHSAGSGVRPDVSPVGTGARYIAHGTTEVEARQITQQQQNRRIDCMCVS